MAPDDQPLSLGPADYEDIDIDDPDNPELAAEDFARAKPLRELFGDEFVAKWQAQRSEFLERRMATVAVSSEVVDFYTAQGEGWRDRLNADLEDLVRIKKRG